MQLFTKDNTRLRGSLIWIAALGCCCTLLTACSTDQVNPPTEAPSPTESSSNVPAAKPTLKDPMLTSHEFTEGKLGYEKILDETGTEAGKHQLDIPEGTRTINISISCNGKGGARVFDASDTAFLLLAPCGDGSGASYAAPVEKFQPPLQVWSSGDYRLVVYGTPQDL